MNPWKVYGFEQLGILEIFRFRVGGVGLSALSAEVWGLKFEVRFWV